MNNIKIDIKKLSDTAIIPSYQTEYSAGADLYSDSDDVEINPGETFLVSTGIAVAIPVGYVGLVYARSGLATKKGLAPANKVGVIDSDYRGEIKVSLHNHSNEARVVEKGERIAQIVFTPYIQGMFNEVDELDDTQRGAGGFGSTGSK